MYLWRDAADKGEHDRLMGEAKKYLNASEKVRMTVDKSIILNRAFLHYYAGEITKALNLVSRIYEEIQKTQEGTHLLVTAMLMMAQIYFLKQNYAHALELYKKCLSTAKGMPARGRIGMAYCFFHLRKYELARACFQRVLALDPGCVEALMGIAIVYEREEREKEYFEYVSRAYRVNRRHPLVLLHLSEHFLFRKELHQCEKFCQLGLAALGSFVKFQVAEEFCRNDQEELRARFNNLLGQVNHINGNFPEAIRHYSQAQGRRLLHNEIALAQCYLHPNTQNYLEAIKLLEDCHRNADAREERLLNDSLKLMAYLKAKVGSSGKQKDERTAEHYYSEAIKFNRHDFEAKIEYANILVDVSKLRALRLLEEAEKIQLTLGNEIRPELLNNIAVLHLENEEHDICQRKLKACLSSLEAICPEGEEEELRVRSLQLIA
jgi:RNA polymerase-associated protein CTR9